MLEKNAAYIYKTNLYIIDNTGNIAYVDMDLKLQTNTKGIRVAHPECKNTGGNNAKHKDMDAGHLERFRHIDVCEKTLMMMNITNAS